MFPAKGLLSAIHSAPHFVRNALLEELLDMPMRGLDILNRVADRMDCERIRIDVDDENRSLDDGWIIGVGESELKPHVDIIELEFDDMEIPREVADVAVERQGPQQ